MFTVNYFALNFGLVGIDYFFDDKVKKSLSPICKVMENQLGEPVYYRVIE